MLINLSLIKSNTEYNKGIKKFCEDLISLIDKSKNNPKLNAIGPNSSQHRLLASTMGSPIKKIKSDLETDELTIEKDLNFNSRYKPIELIISDLKFDSQTLLDNVKVNFAKFDLDMQKFIIKLQMEEEAEEEFHSGKQAPNGRLRSPNIKKVKFKIHFDYIKKIDLMLKKGNQVVLECRQFEIEEQLKKAENEVVEYKEIDLNDILDIDRLMEDDEADNKDSCVITFTVNSVKNDETSAFEDNKRLLKKLVDGFRNEEKKIVYLDGEILQKSDITIPRGSWSGEYHQFDDQKLRDQNNINDPRPSISGQTIFQEDPLIWKEKFAAIRNMSSSEKLARLGRLPDFMELKDRHGDFRCPLYSCGCAFKEYNKLKSHIKRQHKDLEESKIEIMNDGKVNYGMNLLEKILL